MEHPNTRRGDVAYWQLTHAQAARYFSRLSTMHARQATRFADKAVEAARKAEIGTWITAALIALSAALQIAEQVSR